MGVIKCANMDFYQTEEPTIPACDDFGFVQLIERENEKSNNFISFLIHGVT